MSKRLGIIDCGTNTFNLMVAEVEDDGSWTQLLSTKISVKLAPSSTTRKIGNNRFGRGVDALHILRNNLVNMRTEQVYCFATSAIREAVNGRDFIEFVRDNLGMKVSIVTGEEEARMIYLGVRQCLDMGDKPHLVMDIGGGSVEFVICNQETVFWKQSLPIGVSRLKGENLPSDPITAAEVQTIRTYLDHKLTELKAALKQYNPTILLGSSGSFDSIIEMMDLANPGRYQRPLPKANPIPIDELKQLSTTLRATTLDERLMWPGLLPMRADMIVLSFLLIDAVLDIHPIEAVYQTEYALKEGALAFLISQERILEH